MSYELDKREVENFFDNHIIKYIIVDLEVLDKIEADASGVGGCVIPLALSTFAALDLIGYLIHAQERKVVAMSFSDLLTNARYFPDFVQYTTQNSFFDSFRDNLRSIMAHRFSLAKYDIAKSPDPYLFFENNGRQIFNASYFTKITIDAIKKIHAEITSDTFIINGYSKEETMIKMKERIIKLKDFEGSVFVAIANLPITSTILQTTSSLG